MEIKIPWSTIAEKEEGSGRPDIGIDRRQLPWKVSPQQATQSGMMTMLGLLKSGKLVLRFSRRSMASTIRHWKR